MIFRDPRRDTVDTSVSYLKTIGMLSAIAYGGIRLSSSFTSTHREAKRLVASARSIREDWAQAARLFPSIKPKDIEKLSEIKGTEKLLPEGIPDIDSVLNTEEYKRLSGDNILYRPELTIEGDEFDNIGDKLPTSEDLIRDYTLYEPHVREELIRASETLNQKMSLTGAETPWELAGKMSEVTSAKNSFMKEYNTLPGMLTDHGLLMESISSDGRGYTVKIKHIETGKIAKVNLPSYKGGIISKGVTDWLPVLSAQVTTAKAPGKHWDIGQHVVVYKSFGAELLEEAEKIMGARLSMADTGMNPAQIVANSLSHATDSLISRAEEYGRVSEIGGRLTKKLVLKEVLEAKERPGTKSARAIKATYAQIVEGAPIIEITPEGVWEQTGQKVSMSGISEAAYVKSGKIASSPIIGAFPYTPLSSQSHLRQTYAKKLISGERPTISQLARILGPTPSDVLKKLSSEMSEGIPGKMVNIGFWLDELYGVAEGSVAMVVDTRIDIGEGLDSTAKLPSNEIEDLLVKHGLSKTQADEIFQHTNIKNVSVYTGGISINELKEKVKNNSSISKRVKDNILLGRKRGSTILDTFSSVNVSIIDVKEFTKDEAGNAFIHPVTKDLILDKIGGEFDKDGVISKSMLKGKHAPVFIKRGTPLGIDPVSNEMKYTDRDLKLIRMEIDNGLIRFMAAEDIPVAPGRTKLSTTKAIVNRIVAREEVSDLILSEGTFDKEVAKLYGKGKLTGAIDVLMTANQMKKLHGGGIDLGIMNKILGDVASMKSIEIETWIKQGRVKDVMRNAHLDDLKKGLREIMVYMLDRDAVDTILDKLEIDAGGKLAIELKNGISTGHDQFRKLSIMESNILKAQQGNQGAINNLHREAEKLQKLIKTHTGVDYTMSSGLKQYAKLVQSPGDTMKNMPVLVFGNNGTNLKGVFTRTFEATHLASIDSFTKHAGEDRGLNGFNRGRRQGVDDLINARAEGLKHLEQYYTRMLDYKFPYILDKYEAASDWMSEAQYKGDRGAQSYRYNKGSWVKIDTGEDHIGVGATGKKKMAVLSLNDIRGLKQFGNEDFVTRLVTEYENTSNISAATRFRIVMDNLKDMASFTDDEGIFDLMKQNSLSIEQLTSKGLLGGKGNSALIESEVMDELIKLFNSTPDDSILYLQLPREVDIKGRKVKYVPMHKFDMPDIFEMKEHLTGLDLASMDREVIGSFYTGSDFVVNQVNYVRQVAKMEEELRLQAGSETVEKEAIAKLQIATADKSAAIRSSFTGKRSPANRRLVENSIPFSMQGKIISSESVPFGVVAVSPDDAVKFLTGSVVNSMDEAVKLTHEIKTVTDLSHKLRKLTDVFTHETSGKPLEDKLNNILEEIAGIKSKPFAKDVQGLTDTISEYMNSVGLKSKDTLDKTVNIPASTVKSFPAIYEHIQDTTPNIMQKANTKLKSSILNHITDISGKIDMTNRVRAMGKEATDILLDLGMEWSNDNMYLNYPDMNKTDYFPGSKVVRPNRFISTGVIRYPLLSSASARDLQLTVINDRGISRKLLNELTKDNVKKIHQMHDAPIYMDKLTAEAMAGDMDGDLAFMENRALDYLEERRTTIDDTINLSRTLNMTNEDFKNLSRESMIHGIQERLAIVGPDNELLPANRQSIKMMYSIYENGYQDRIVTNTIKEEIDRIISESNVGKIEANQIRDDIYNNIRKSTKNFSNIEFSNIQDMINEKMVVVTRAKTPEEVEKAREGMAEAKKKKALLTTAGKEAEMLKLEPTISYNELVDKLTPEQNAVRKAIEDETKAILPQLRKEMQLTQVHSFINIKEGTPPAYKLRTAIRHISSNYLTNEKERAFLDVFASETIAQQTISSKHGTPDVLDDLLATFRKLSDKNVMLDDNIFDKVSRYNFSVNLAPEIMDEMGEWGLIQPSAEVDYDMYEDYLSKKKEHLSLLKKVNDEADMDILRKITDGEKDIEALNSTRRKYIDGKMSNYKMVNKSGESKKVALKYWGYGSSLVEEKLNESETWIKNARKHRRESLLYKIFSMGIPGENPEVVWEKTTEKIRPYVEKITRSFREFHKLHGATVMQDRGYAAITKFGNDGVSTLDIMNDMQRKLSDGVPFEVSGAMEKRVSEFVAWVQGKQEAEVTFVDVENRTKNLQKLHYNEQKNLIKLRTERIAQESTVFRLGSVIDRINNETIKHTASAADDQLLKSANKLRIGTILMGLVVGAVAGQAVNQMTSGYAVPDLENTKGLGGEYYEHNSGIMGREMEIMLKPRPAKLVSQYGDGMSVANASRHIQNMATVLSATPERRDKYIPKYRGYVVG